MSDVYTVAVEFAFDRPPTPANTKRTHVVVAACTDHEAELVAAQIVACRPDCVMPTRTTILSVVL